MAARRLHLLKVMRDDRGTLRGAVFDLDGVVTLTARLHFEAWKRVFEGLTHKPFDEQAYKRWVDGRPRLEGLRAYLDAAHVSADADTIMGLAERKNAYFLELLEREGPAADPAAIALIRDLRRRKVPVGLATSSRNADTILRRAGIAALFDATVDGIESARLRLRGKPHPDIFLECTRRLGDLDPSAVVLFEDAAAGVAAGKAGGFGLVVGVDRDGNWMPLRENGAEWIIRDFRELSFDRIVRWMRDRAHRRPNLLAGLRELEALARAKPLAIFLDYDGTLTPIVARPELALLSDEMRETVARLSDRRPVAIVSGRGLEDLKEKVALESIWYAASHGFEIESPGASRRHLALPELEPTIRRAAQALRPRVERVAGALVEDKRFSIAVHHRMAAPERVRELERAVDEVIARHAGLRKTYGKQVIEIRSSVDWNKGRAVHWLMEAMGVAGAVPIYIGDDTTDEDGFAAVLNRGLGVLVTETPRPTEARWSLQNPGEVRMLLDRIAALRADR